MPGDQADDALVFTVDPGPDLPDAARLRGALQADGMLVMRTIDSVRCKEGQAWATEMVLGRDAVGRSPNFWKKSRNVTFNSHES